jgi:hypothetical protein
LDTFFNRRVEQGSSHFRSKLAVFRSKLESSRLVPAVTSSLVEFQEVQTYFIIATQIATLTNYNRETTDTAGVNDTSYAAVLLDAGLATFLSLLSLPCVLLVQCTLQRAHMHWWYIFTMVTLNCIFAVALFASRGNLLPPADGLFERFTHDAPLTSCGDKPSPMTYCKPAGAGVLDTSAIGYVLCGHIALAWPGLFIDHLAFTVSTRFADRLNAWDQRGIFRSTNKIWRFVTAVYWFCLELFLPLLVVYELVVLVQVSQFVTISGTSSWSFGQVIAVGIWAPTIVKFVYYNICKSSSSCSSSPPLAPMHGEFDC